MSWKEAVAAIAPVLSSALPPPFNVMAERLVRSSLGLDADADGRLVSELIARGDPAVLAKVRIAELELIENAKALDVNLERIAFEDRASARKMANEKQSMVPGLLTWSALLMLAAELLFIVHTGGIPSSLDNAFGGALLLAPLTLAQQGFNFFLGSSAGSSQKNALLLQGRSKTPL